MIHLFMEEKEIKYAGFSQRLLAHNIDLLPIFALMFGSTFLFPKAGFDWLIFSLIYFGYHIGFELTNWQATPGKRIAKIHVEVEDEKSTLRIILRNFLKIFSLLLFFAGFVFIIFNERSKGLHDYLARTVVVFDD